MQKFLAQNISYNDFISLNYPKSNKYILENNLSILNKVFNFLQNKENILLINGFKGTGKTDIANHILNFLSRDVYSFKIYCNTATTLDDILLQLWSQFISVASNTEINFKYIQSNSFQDKISTCFTKCFSNILITIYDFDLVIDENKTDIINFISTFNELDKIKTVITAKTFDTALLYDDTTYTKIIVKALTRITFEKYLIENNIKASSHMVDELYKITRGYYFYTQITTSILNIKKLNINDYLIAYTNSGISFDKFLAKAYISMLPESTFKILNILAMFNHNINSQILDYFGCYDEQVLELLKSRHIIDFKNNMYILNSFFREEIFSLIDESEKLHLQINLAKFYNNQLPLKPSERIILLSRITLRRESEYFKQMISLATDSQSSQEIHENEQEDLTPEALYEQAQIAEKEYRLQDVLKNYTKLLEITGDKLKIYPKLAETYTKLGNNKFALHYADYLINYYSKNNDIENSCIYELQQAKIYHQMYKTNTAIEILNHVIASDISSSTLIDANTYLANIYIGLSDKFHAKEHYKKAIDLINAGTDYSELYFKYALILEENDEEDIAIVYYKKCIESASPKNKYFALSLSNLGDYYLDNNDYQTALNYFEQAFSADEHNSNYYGMYYAASKLAKIYKKQGNNTKLYNQIVIAKKSALNSKDIYAIASTGLYFGDYYAHHNQHTEALNEYFAVLTMVKDKLNGENIKKIHARIEDIKQIIGEEEYNAIARNYR